MFHRLLLGCLLLIGLSVVVCASTSVASTDCAAGQKFCVTTDGVAHAMGYDLLPGGTPTDSSFCGFSASNYSSLNALISAVGSTQANVCINTSLTVTGTVTSPSNLQLVFLPGGSLAIASGTVTINGPIIASSAQTLFTGASCQSTTVACVAFPLTTQVAELWADWYGFDPSETAANNKLYLNNALLSGHTRIRIGSGTYSINGQINQQFGQCVKGSGESDAATQVPPATSISTVISYTGAAKAWMINGNPNGYIWRACIENLKITSSTGTHGIEIADIASVKLDQVVVRGFSSAGIHITSTSGLYAISVIITRSESFENGGNGILIDGVNAADNHIVVMNSRIRGNTGVNIKSTVDIRTLSLIGNDLEGSTTGGVELSWVRSGLINGNYFEQTVASTFAIKLVNTGTQAAGGITISGNNIQVANGSTAVILGDGAASYGLEGITIKGNAFTGGPYTAIDPVHVHNGEFGPNYTGILAASGITHVGTPGANSRGLIIYDENASGLVTRTYTGGTGGILGPMYDRVNAVEQHSTGVLTGLIAGDDIRLTNRGLVWDNGSTGLGGQIKKHFLTVANNGTAPLNINSAGTATSFNGRVLIMMDSGYTCAFNTKGGLNATAKVDDTDNKCSVTAGNAGTTNVYWSAGNARYEIENKSGASLSYSITFDGYGLF